MRKILASLLAGASLLITAPATADETAKHKYIGLGFDVGVPEGAAVGVVVSPYFYWAKVNLHYTNNYFASGGRAGLTLDPVKWAIGPTLTTEYGFTGKFNPSDTFGKNLPDASYQYVNIQPGLEFGSPNRFRFFLRAGFTHLWANAYNFNSVVNTANTTVSDPKANLWLMPTFKLGFSVLIF